MLTMTQAKPVTEKVVQPPVDVAETKDAILLFADLPGVGKDSVDVTVERNVLTFEARPRTNLPEGFKATHLELSPNVVFRRSFSIGEAVDRARIEATVKDGILVLSLPKADRTRERKIEIRT